MNLNHVTLPVHDVERGMLFYQGMGFRLTVNASPEHVRFECPTGESQLVSELCQMPIETPVEHRGLPTRTEWDRCGGKCLRRCDLVCVEVSC
jgi:catechol 2,3-dioxygenase-like lactoylglutathione lyase family enzyme